MYPVISVVGWHNAGKTTFVALLLAELSRRGLRVAAIKHSQGHFDLDHPGTDTQRYTDANADVVGIVGHGRIALVEHRGVSARLAEHLARLPDDLDLVIVEGYKRERVAKFELTSREGEHTAISPQELLLSEVVGEPLGPAASAPQAQGARPDAIGIREVSAALDILSRRGFLGKGLPV